MRFSGNRLNILAGVACLLPAVTAFGDTSPFFVISSTDISSSLSSIPDASTLSTKDFVALAKDVISPCTSDAYILVHQPGIHASDFKSGKCAPHMKRAMVSGREIEKRDTSMQTQRTFEVPYGRHLGDMDREVIEILEWWAKEKCAAEVVGIDASTGSFSHFDDMKPKVVKVDFPEIKTTDEKARAEALRDADTFLFSIISLLPTDKWTLIYTSSPRGTVLEAADEPKTILKRVSIIEQDDEPGKNSTTPPTPSGGVFQRYQFFTPAIFMGYITAFLLLLIGYVALSALTSLKVSYAAFEKEMGPAAAKKQQ